MYVTVKTSYLRVFWAFNNQNPNRPSYLPWGTKEMDYCRWDKVTCEPTSKRVTQLYLNGTGDPDLGGWILNASLFLPIQDLNVLILSFNQLTVQFDGKMPCIFCCGIHIP